MQFKQDKNYLNEHNISKDNRMNILSIVKDNRTTGVEYGTVEIDLKPSQNTKEKLFKTKYADAQFNQLKRIKNRTKHK